MAIALPSSCCSNGKLLHKKIDKAESTAYPIMPTYSEISRARSYLRAVSAVYSPLEKMKFTTIVCKNKNIAAQTTILMFFPLFKF